MKKAIKGLRLTATATALAVSAQLFGSVALGPGADALNGTVEATTRVHVRTQPTTSSTSLTVLNPGQKVQAKGTTNGWTKVDWNGRTAYVYSKYLTTTASSTPVVNTGTSSSATTTANLNVRTGPSLQYRIVAVAPRGTTVSLTGRTSGSFAQVMWQGTERWMSTQYLSMGTSTPVAPDAKTGSVQTTANLNIRTGSSTSYRRVAVAPRGTILAATGKTANGFNEVIWQGALRWASSQYLKSVGDSATEPAAPGAGTLPATTTRWATTALNIWTASSGSRYNGEIPRGGTLAVTGVIENGRAQIIHNGAIRWVTARYTTATDPNGGSTPPSTSTPGNWDLTSAPITGGLRGTALNKGWSSGLERTNPQVQRIAADVWYRFPEIKTQYGWRRDVTPDHPAGRAVDVMIPNHRTSSSKTLGWAIANYYRANAKELGISYIIWDQKIWSVARNSEGWRSMASRGNDTANHKDHVHINTY